MKYRHGSCSKATRWQHLFGLKLCIVAKIHSPVHYSCADLSPPALEEADDSGFSPHGRLWNGRSGWPPLLPWGTLLENDFSCGQMELLSVEHRYEMPGWGAWSHWPPLLLYFFKPIVLKYSTFSKEWENRKARKWDRAGVGAGVPMVPLCMLSHFSHVQLFATLWTIAHQASLSMGLSRQE